MPVCFVHRAAGRPSLLRPDPPPVDEHARTTAGDALRGQLAFLQGVAADPDAPRADRLRALELLARIAGDVDDAPGRTREPASKHAAKHAAKHASKHAAKHASKHAAKHASKHAGKQAARPLAAGAGPKALAHGASGPRRLAPGGGTPPKALPPGR